MASSLSQSAPPSSSSPPAIAAANRTSDTDENDSATSNATVQLASLRAEIADLRERLERADHERAQAGQLGLHLLREKEQLELAHEVCTHFFVPSYSLGLISFLTFFTFYLPF
jgi:hypothetical protein